MSIPGVPIIHPREEWELTGYGIDDMTSEPPAIRWGPFDQGVVHYSAAMNLPDGDSGESVDQIGPWLGAAQRDYYVNRSGGGYTRKSDGAFMPGYALGYSWAVDWLGGAWELRGFQYQPAATSQWNRSKYPILFLTDRHDPGSELMWATARALWRHAQRLNGPTWNPRPTGHGMLYANTGIGTPTACPGTALLDQIARGYGDINYQEDKMRPLTEPERAYDSRVGPVTRMTAGLREANATLPQTPMEAGETRRVVIGICTEAHVHLTAVGTTPGYLSISGTSNPSPTSLVNVDPDGVSAAGAPVACPEGAVYVTSSHGGVDVIVDVFARG